MVGARSSASGLKKPTALTEAARRGDDGAGALAKGLITGPANEMPPPLLPALYVLERDMRNEPAAERGATAGSMCDGAVIESPYVRPSARICWVSWITFLAFSRTFNP